MLVAVAASVASPRHATAAAATATHDAARPTGGSGPHVPRHRRAAALGAVPGSLRLPGRAPGAGPLAATRRVRGGDARTRGRRLERPSNAPCESRSSSRSTTATGATSPRRCRSSRRTAGRACSTSTSPTSPPPGGSRDAGVRRLIAAGWEIDAHSMTHADLAALGGTALAREVGGLTARDPPPVRHHAAVLLLPRGPLRRGSGRSRRGRRVRGRHDDVVRPRVAWRRPVHARASEGRPRRRRRRPGAEARRARAAGAGPAGSR